MGGSRTNKSRHIYNYGKIPVESGCIFKQQNARRVGTGGKLGVLPSFQCNFKKIDPCIILIEIKSKCKKKDASIGREGNGAGSI